MKITCLNRRSHPRLAVVSHVAVKPSVLPLAFPRDESSIPYGVHGLAPLGRGSSPRWAIQIRSGVSAYTAPVDPHVHPSCEWRVSGRGRGELGTRSYGPTESRPPD